jgi:hypothetical protein
MTPPTSQVARSRVSLAQRDLTQVARRLARIDEVRQPTKHRQLMEVLKKRQEAVARAQELLEQTPDSSKEA